MNIFHGVFDYRIRIRIHTESRFRFSEKVHSNNESESGFRFGETGLQYCNCKSISIECLIIETGSLR